MPTGAIWTLRGPYRGYWRCVAAAADRRFGLMLWQHCPWESICASLRCKHPAAVKSSQSAFTSTKPAVVTKLHWNFR